MAKKLESMSPKEIGQAIHDMTPDEDPKDWGRGVNPDHSQIIQRNGVARQLPPLKYDQMKPGKKGLRKIAKAWGLPIPK